MVPTQKEDPWLFIGLKQKSVARKAFDPIVMCEAIWDKGTCSVGKADWDDGDNSNGIEKNLPIFAYDEAKKEYAWDFHFSPEYAYKTMPPVISYSFLGDDDISTLKITFSNADDSNQVVYSIDLPEDDDQEPKQMGVMNISSLTPDSGKPKLSGFCKIRFAYTSPKEALPFTFILLGEHSTDVEGFPIVLPPRAFPINAGTTKGGTFSKGSLKMGLIMLEQDGDDYVWDFAFDPGRIYSYVPSGLDYIHMPYMTVKEVKEATISIRFSNGTDQIKYSDLTIKPGAHTIDLSPPDPEPGSYQKADFSEIRIVSDSNIKLQAMLLFDTRSFRDVTYEFEIDIPRE